MAVKKYESNADKRLRLENELETLKKREQRSTSVIQKCELGSRMRTVEHELQKQDISEGKPLRSYINNSKTNTPQHTARELPTRREMPKSGSNTRNVPERRELPTITERPIEVQTSRSSKSRLEELPARREIPASGTQGRSRGPEELPYYRSVSSNASQRENLPARRTIPYKPEDRQTGAKTPKELPYRVSVDSSGKRTVSSAQPTNLPARRDMPKAGTQPKTPKQMYSEYGKGVRTPSIEEFNKLKRTGLDIDFNSYAKQKLKTSPQSYETFMSHLKTGEPIKERFGNATVYTNPQNFGSKDKPRPRNLSTDIDAVAGAQPGYDCYIFYTQHSEGDFYAQAMYQKQLMEAEGKSVRLILANSSEAFINGWDTIPGGAENVMIFSHSNPTTLILSEDKYDGLNLTGINSLHEEIGNIKNLSPKEIDSLTIFGCNAGHLDVAEIDGGNAAQAFAGIEGINHVIAYDGSVGFGPNGAEIDGSDPLYARRAFNQGSFWEDADPYGIHADNWLGRHTEGRVVYYPDGTYEVIGWERVR